MHLKTRIKGAFDQLMGTSDDKVSLLFQSGSSKKAVSYLSAYEKSIYINKALEKRATKVGEIEFILKQGDKTIEQAPLLELLARPNPFLSQQQFFALWNKYRDIFGEVYIWKKKDKVLFKGVKVSELHPLYPPCVTKVYNEDGTISHYNYQVELKGSIRRYEVDEIIYDRRPDPRDYRNGVSLLKAGLTAIASSLEIEQLQYDVLVNGGKLDTVISFKDRDKLSKLQTEELKEKYIEKYQEAKRSGAPMFLGGDVQVNNLGLTPAELGYIEGKKMTLNDLCILTEMPRALLALPEGSTFDNGELALRSFLRETVYPIHKELATIINNDLDLAPVGQELTCIDPTPDNIDEKIKLAESGLKGYISINEARELFGRDAVDNGDEIMVSFNQVPLSQATAEPLPAPEPNADASNTPSDNADNKKGISNHPLQNKEFRAKYHKNFIKKADKNEAIFKKALNSYLISQRERLLDKVNRYVRAYKKTNAEELFDIELEVAIGQKRLMSVILDIAKRSGQDAIDLVGGKRDFNVKANLHSWLENKSKIFLKQINETTFSKLKTEFADSLNANESYSDLASRVKSTYKDITTGRSYTIARTETNGIMSKSTLEGYDQVGMRLKIWVAVMDANTRDSHAEMDGEERDLNQPFSNGMMFPGDEIGDASETINCRCSI